MNNDLNSSNETQQASNGVMMKRIRWIAVLVCVIGLFYAIYNSVFNHYTQTQCDGCGRWVDCKMYYYYDYDGEKIEKHYCRSCSEKLPDEMECPLFD